MISEKLTNIDIVSIYKNKFAQKPYPFNQTVNGDAGFNDREWIKIKIKSDRTKPKLLPFVIAINEIYRFEVGFTQPELRLTDTYLLSRRIEQDADVGEFRVRMLFYCWNQMINGGNLFWEGMGRVVLCKYLFQENDFNLNNATIDINNYFIALDSEASFWPVTEKYHYGPGIAPENVKVLFHNNTPYKAKTVRLQSGAVLHVISEKRRDYIGSIHVNDYDALPVIKHFHPSNWFFHFDELKDYSKTLAKDQRFLNEKHFSALKSLITLNVKQLLIDLHIEDKRDKSEALNFITSQIQKLIGACKRSQEFIHYVQTNRLTAVQVILFEVSRFFKNSHAYKINDKAIQLEFEESIYIDVIKQFERLLIELNDSLQEVEVIELMSYVKKIIEQSVELAATARDFYKSQLMHYHATLADKELNASLAV